MTQGTVRIAKELHNYYDNCISLVKSMRFVFSIKLLFELDTNGTYYVICPTFYNHCIPCLIFFENMLYVKVMYILMNKMILKFPQINSGLKG